MFRQGRFFPDKILSRHSVPEQDYPVIERAPSSACCVVEFMNQFCHGEERSDAAIHLDFSWIATPSFLGLAMTNRGVH